MVTVRGAIGIVPARGGSKRIPRKNVVPIGGKPMIAWTIEAALQSAVLDRVIVSTDDEEIAELSRRYGAEVPFLRDGAADDMASVSAATLRALAQAETHFGECYHTVVQLMPNCPVRGADDIRSGLEVFKRLGRVAQISCFQFGWMNPWWAVKLDALGAPQPMFPGSIDQRSQDLPPLYCPSGAVWIADTAALRQAGDFWTSETKLEPLSWQSAMDIDSFEDLEMAAALFAMRSVKES